MLRYRMLTMELGSMTRTIPICMIMYRISLVSTRKIYNLDAQQPASGCFMEIDYNIELYSTVHIIMLTIFTH